MNIYLAGGLPSTPSNNVTTTRIGTSCYYWARTKVNNTNDVVLWSDTGTDPFYAGVLYYSGGFYYIRSQFEYDPAGSYSVKLKAQNDCGYSGISPWKNFTTPEPPSGCMYRLAGDTISDEDIISEEMMFANDCIVNCFTYQLKLIASASENCMDENYRIIIYNIYGQLLTEREFKGMTEFDISQLTTGIFVSVILDHNGKIISSLKFYK